MTDPCSLWAYDDIVRSGYLGERQARVLEIFTSEPLERLTATDIVRRLGRGVSEGTRNRVTELEQMGFLKKVGVIKCPVTRRMVNQYLYTGRKKPLEYREEWTECRVCEGKGGKVKRHYFEYAPTVPSDLFQSA